MKIIKGDITKIKADAIVNAANTSLQHGGGVARAIVAAGGKVIQEQSDKIGWCPIGKAVCTSAGNLPAKYVIHVPTIDYRSGKKASLVEIKKGAKAAFKLAKKLGCKSIALPLLGAGVVGLNKENVCKALEEASSQFSEISSFLVIR